MRKRENRIIFSIFLTLFIISLVTFSILLYEVYESSVIKVAVLKINGPIAYSSDLDIDKLLETIENLNESSYKAVVLYIDSPGGAVVPVYKIVKALEKLNKTKIAYIDEIGASGAYWIACTSDYIISNPYSEVGSIGVIFSYFQVSDFLKKLGIKYVVIKEGEYKDIGSPFRNLTPEEKRFLKEQLDVVYKDFVDYVKSKRNVSEDVFESWVYVGKIAKEKGLVDDIGTFDKVKEYLSRKFNVTEDKIVFVYYNFKKKSLIDEIMSSYLGSVLNILLRPLLLS